MQKDKNSQNSAFWPPCGHVPGIGLGVVKTLRIMISLCEKKSCFWAVFGRFWAGYRVENVAHNGIEGKRTHG